MEPPGGLRFPLLGGTVGRGGAGAAGPPGLDHTLDAGFAPQLLVLSWWRAAGFRGRSGRENLAGNEGERGEEAGAVGVLGAKRKFSFLHGTLRFGAACGGRARVLGVTSEPLFCAGTLSKGAAPVCLYFNHCFQSRFHFFIYPVTSTYYISVV